MNLTEEDLKNLASQLAKPYGEMGVKVGENMQISNANMTDQTILALRVADNDYILEIGPGNANHLDSLLSGREGIKYAGVDISKLMIDEAKKKNEAYLKSGAADFTISDGCALPFLDNTFNKIFTVNTVYFWEQPVIYAKEVCRCLKPGGVFALTFAEKAFMEKLPFTRFGFTLYDQEKAINLLAAAGFSMDAVLPFKETIKGNMGENVERDFLVVLASKGN